MNRTDLAKQLRTEIADPDFATLTDEEVLTWFNTCGRCDAQFCSPVEYRKLIKESKCLGDFVEGMDQVAEAHRAKEVGALRKRFADELPDYIITPTLYLSQETLDKLPDDPDDPAYEETEPERFTIVVLRTKDDEVVNVEEYFRTTDEDLTEKFIEALRGVDEWIPDSEKAVCIEPQHAILEPCACGDCDGFLMDYVSTEDYCRDLEGSNS